MGLGDADGRARSPAFGGTGNAWMRARSGVAVGVGDGLAVAGVVSTAPGTVDGAGSAVLGDGDGVATIATLGDAAGADTPRQHAEMHA